MRPSSTACSREKGTLQKVSCSRDPTRRARHGHLPRISKRIRVRKNGSDCRVLNTDEFVQLLLEVAIVVKHPLCLGDEELTLRHDLFPMPQLRPVCSIQNSLAERRAHLESGVRDAQGWVAVFVLAQLFLRVLRIAQATDAATVTASTQTFPMIEPRQVTSDRLSQDNDEAGQLALARCCKLSEGDGRLPVRQVIRRRVDPAPRGALMLRKDVSVTVPRRVFTCAHQVVRLLPVVVPRPTKSFRFQMIEERRSPAFLAAYDVDSWHTASIGAHGLAAVLSVYHVVRW
eukprot:CAMPEP_0205897524 /NCGR_PEP_ID=MMETSP1083-20121108/25540_1 /ASSEMBLY_ACC=CAM_ASM_000430 /TAXON_ID=97485 /ORGANISM="Prymnesium parvum, Strain Texoma1" /LENGTH=286 /DNA_ID=CAMNT_0053262683 /DNA_START=46 /DNA_END=903 /DNA_ORIENTATION=-